MPLDLTVDTDAFMEVEDVVAFLHDNHIDMEDPESLSRAAPALKALCNNRHFLADRAVAELEGAFGSDDAAYLYTAQVMVLHRPARRDRFFMRANMWPSPRDAIMQTAGPGAFFYHRPHDHNFNFLTVGYLGPGYGSNYYEYDPQTVAGFPGEVVDSLRFVRRKSLSQGDVMLYRASVDVHDQLPPEAFSISLNIVENTARSRCINQYSFDLDARSISRLINVTPAPAIFAAAAHLDPEGCEPLVSDIASGAINPVTRFMAHKALASRSADPRAYCDRMERAGDDPARVVREWAKAHIENVGEGMARLRATSD